MRHSPAALCGVLLLASLAVATWGLSQQLPAALWWAALWNPVGHGTAALLVHYTWLPRAAVALTAGAGLAAAGVVFQQVLGNPLAEPGTLGTAAGAQLALAVTLVWAPGLLAGGRDWVALAGAGLATMLVFLLAVRHRRTPDTIPPLSLVLSGMIVGLTCGAAGTSLIVLHDNYLTASALFLFGAGALDQHGWSVAASLVGRLLPVLGLMALMARPLMLLELGAQTARSLGLGLAGVRIAAMLTGVCATAFTVSAAGVIGFVGLAAPQLARLAGARRFPQSLLWSPPIGALLLWLTDGLVQAAGRFRGDIIPTGAAMALIGAPVMVWMTLRLREGRIGPQQSAGPTPLRRTPLGLMFGLAVLATAVALDAGRGPQGWHLSDLGEFTSLLPWRGPRVAAAMAAGGLLALSGTLLQRVTGNPMASPELLGVSAGGALGLIALLAFLPDAGPAAQFTGCAAGALATLGAILLADRGAARDPRKILLIGVAASAMAHALIGILLAEGNLRMASVFNWLAGSTYGATPGAALALSLATIGVLALAALLLRWLAVLPLGPSMAQSLGVDIQRSGVAILAVAGLAAAAATVAVGPFGFVGLMGPHFARLLGARRPAEHLLASALAGAVIMVAADWIGRTLLFPYELPAGVVAAMLGGVYFLWLSRKTTQL